MQQSRPPGWGQDPSPPAASAPAASAWGQGSPGASAWGPTTPSTTTSLRDVMEEQKEQEKSQKKQAFQNKRADTNWANTSGGATENIFKDTKAKPSTGPGFSRGWQSSEVRHSKTTSPQADFPKFARHEGISPKATTSTRTTVVNVKPWNLKRMGFENLEEWLKDPNNVYIGRNMSMHVPGAVGSKWKNPFKEESYEREECVRRFRQYIKSDPAIHENGKTLIASVGELKGKCLGCWCHPEQCHGDVLADLANESQ